MPDDTTNPALLPAASPAEAYSADLERLRLSGPIGASDDGWLVLAHTLFRCAELPEGQRRAAVASAADALAASAFATGLDSDAPVVRAATALRNLGDATGSTDDACALATDLAVASQAVAEEQELAGAFGLAFATLRGVLGAFGSLVAPRAQGNVLAQLGRAARQLGATDVAREMYNDTMAVGYESESLDLVARGLLGHGVMALTRGNYPTARELFERALANADVAKDPDLLRSAHHGLFNCGFSSGDLDAAMVHGWNVLRLCISPDSRAEALFNMAEVCRLTGEHDAALRTYAVAKEWTTQAKVRLHATSGALQSAVAVDRLSDARQLSADLSVLLPTMPDTYTRASIGVEMADALHRLGDAAAATICLREAKALALLHSYHEVVHRAEQTSVMWQRAVVTTSGDTKDRRRKRSHRSEHFRMVLRSLNGLTTSAS